MHVKLVLEIKYEFIFISNCLLRGEKKKHRENKWNCFQRVCGEIKSFSFISFFFYASPRFANEYQNQIRSFLSYSTSLTTNLRKAYIKDRERKKRVFIEQMRWDASSLSNVYLYTFFWSEKPLANIPINGKLVNNFLLPVTMRIEQTIQQTILVIKNYAKKMLSRS